MASMMSCCGWVCRHAARHSRPDVTIAIRDCAGARWAWAWLLACTCVDGRRRRRSICCISAAAACAALPSSSACIYLHADGCTARHQAMCGPRARLHVHYAGSTQGCTQNLQSMWCRTSVTALVPSMESSFAKLLRPPCICMQKYHAL